MLTWEQKETSSLIAPRTRVRNVTSLCDATVLYLPETTVCDLHNLPPTLGCPQPISQPSLRPPDQHRNSLRPREASLEATAAHRLAHRLAHRRRTPAHARPTRRHRGRIHRYVQTRANITVTSLLGTFPHHAPLESPTRVYASLRTPWPALLSLACRLSSLHRPSASLRCQFIAPSRMLTARSLPGWTSLGRPPRALHMLPTCSQPPHLLATCWRGRTTAIAY